MEGESREMNENKFATLVFMDMETTGLIEQGNNPKITELCLVSVQREELLNENSTARVLNKLLMCFNPVKPVSPMASELTGLYNDCLESQRVFCVETAQLINSFLQHLPQPVCLLAHNGHHFDFPILMAELNKLNQSFASTVFCADTLEAFRSLDGLVPSPWNQYPWQQNNKTPDVTTLRNSPPKVKRKENVPNSDEDAGNTDLKHINALITAKKKLKFDQEHVTAQQHDPKTNLKPSTINEEHLDWKDTENVCTETMANWDLVISVDAEKSETSTKLSDSSDFTQCEQILDTQNKTAESNSQQSLSDVQSLPDKDLYQFVLEIEQNLDNHEVEPKECPSENLDYNQDQDNNNMSYKEQNSSGGTTKDTNENAAHASISCCNQTPGTSVTSYVAMGTGYIVDTNSSTDLSTKSSNQTMQVINQNPSNNKQRFENANETNGYKGDNSTVTSQIANRKPFVSYKLEKIYERTFQTLPPITHTAESDCITLMKVAQKRGPDFLSWVNSHAVLFSGIRPVY